MLACLEETDRKKVMKLTVVFAGSLGFTGLYVNVPPRK